MSTRKSYYRWRTTAALSLLLILCGTWGCGTRGSAPLWPGSKYTEADRVRATLRALDYIDHSASDPKQFAKWGADYVYCFYSIEVTARDPELREAAKRLAIVYSKRWAKLESVVPVNGKVDYIAFLVFGWLPAMLEGESDARVKPELIRAAARFNAVDYMLFDPSKEAPPSDIPEDCEHDSTRNPRGATVCKKCGRRLTMRTKYEVWMDALITTYSGDRYGIQLGAPYRDVVQWMGAMRPYLNRKQSNEDNFIDTLYALTHLVYTLNDYGQHLLPRDLLPQEFAYLKENLGEAIALHDPETMGEFLDTLKSFGLTRSDQVIRTGVTYLLDTQRADGTWSDPKEKDAYTLYHSAWTGIDGLKECRWQGEALSFPEVRPLLDKMRQP